MHANTDPLLTSSSLSDPLEVDSIAPGNDAVPLNEDSIVPQYLIGYSQVSQRNEMDYPPQVYNYDQTNLSPVFAPPEVAAPPFILPGTQTKSVQRSVDTPITFRDYVAKEWIEKSDNANRVRNVSFTLDLLI